MVKLLDTLTGTKRVLVTENQRALVLEKGRFADILTAGEHRLKNSAQVHMFDLNTPEFATPLKDALFRERPELAEAHLLRVTAGDGEAKVISREG
ncbi:MAG TPA: slipin family protein, partial [Rhodobacteraceae bacterium]|nr:slipin family protein [Paracoccaceae bacterium]